MDKHRHFKLERFQEIPIIAKNRNRNLKEIIGGNMILKNKVIRKKNAEKKHLFVAHAA